MKERGLTLSAKTCLRGFTVSYNISVFFFFPSLIPERRLALTKISQAASSHFQAASSILPLINKVNLFPHFFFFFQNPTATNLALFFFSLPSTVPQYIFLQLTGKKLSSFIRSTQPHSLITRVLLSVIFPSSSAAVVTNGT